MRNGYDIYPRDYAVLSNFILQLCLVMNVSFLGAPMNGGAFHLQSGVHERVQISIQECTFKDIKILGLGGALFIKGNGKFDFGNSCFFDIESNGAGAICILAYSAINGNPSRLEKMYFLWYFKSKYLIN